MTKSLERRLARLEECLPPSAHADTLEVNFVAADGEVVETRIFEFPWCPPQLPTANRWRGRPGR
jgi:hypothetical protein